MKRFLIRFIFIKRRLQLFIIFLLTVLLFYYNISAVNYLSPIPSYKSKCDINAAKYLIRSLVINSQFSFLNNV